MVGQMRCAFEKTRMQIKDVAGVGLTAGRPLQKQAQCAVRDRMLGKIVVHNQHVAPLMHEVFAHRAACVGSDVLQRRGIAGRRAEDDGIPQRVVRLQRLHELRNARRLLADGDIDAHDVLILLVEDRVERNGRLAGLAVADDEFALAAADGEHGIDGQKSRLHGLVDRLAVDDAGGGSFNGVIIRFGNFALAVDRRAERIDHAAEKRISDRDTGGSAAAEDDAARLYGGLARKNNAADTFFLQIEHHAAHAVFKNQNLAVFRARQTADLGDAVAVGEDGADLSRGGLRLEILQRFAEQRDNVAPAADGGGDLVLQLTAFAGAAPVIDQLTALALAELQPEAVLHPVVPLPVQVDRTLVFLMQEVAQLRKLLLGRSGAAVYAGLQLLLTHALCSPLDCVQKIRIRIVRVGDQLVDRVGDQRTDLLVGLTQHGVLFPRGLRLCGSKNFLLFCVCACKTGCRFRVGLLHGVRAQLLGFRLHAGERFIGFADLLFGLLQLCLRVGFQSGIILLPFFHECGDGLIQKEIQSARQDDQIKHVQQDLLPVDIQRYSHTISPLQHEDDQNGDDQGINDGGLNKDQTQHHRGPDAAGGFRLAGHALGALADGDGHAERTGRCDKTHDNGRGDRLCAGRVFSRGRGFRGRRSVSGIRSAGRHGEQRADKQHDKHQGYHSFCSQFHFSVPPFVKRPA